MPLMDDYYRQKAAANTGHKPIRDAIPNGTHVIQRTYGDLKVPVHRDAVKSLARMPLEFVIRQALKVECRACAAPIGARCLSYDKRKMGEVMKHVHSQRAHDGMKLVRK
jgi:hypothetical protein